MIKRQLIKKTEELTALSGKLAEKMYADAGAQGAAEGASADAEKDAKADDVVDAEFEEVKEDDNK